MKIAIVCAVVLTWPLCIRSALVAQAPQRTLLQLQRFTSSDSLPPAFDGPVENAQPLNLKGFCVRPDDDEPACKAQPCCCWSTFAADTHPTYPNQAETRAKQECKNPPEGFVYAPEPGLTYDDGQLDTLRKQGLPEYKGRRLCCLRRDLGVQDESQRDLRYAVKTTTTTITTTTTEEYAEEPEAEGVAEVPQQFTTEVFTTSLMNPGDEYETAQMEEAAREHLEAAHELQEAVAGLNMSASAISEVNQILQTDPNLVRSRKNVAQMKAAINEWVKTRWMNLKKLKAGDASAFGPPPGMAPAAAPAPVALLEGSPAAAPPSSAVISQA
jgi:hypothetical protein